MAGWLAVMHYAIKNSPLGWRRFSYKIPLKPADKPKPANKPKPMQRQKTKEEKDLDKELGGIMAMMGR